MAGSSDPTRGESQPRSAPVSMLVAPASGFSSLSLVLMLLLLLAPLFLVDVLMGGDGHPGDQDHELPKAELLVFVSVQLTEQAVDGRMVLPCLQGNGGGGKWR